MLSKLDLNYLELFKKKYIYGCELCGGKDSFCVCWKKYNEEIKKVSAGIPVKYRKYTLSDFTHPQLKDQKNFVESVISDFDNVRLEGTTLYFYGSSGTAKTMSSVLIACEGIRRGYSVKYYESLQSISSNLKQAWAEDNTSKVINDITSSDLLIVDNLCSENISNENVRNEIYNLFKQRSYHCLPTIFISPVGLSEISIQLDRDIVELFLSNNFNSIYFKGFDYRKKVLGE
jgi:DNA replication protein DnaC